MRIFNTCSVGGSLVLTALGSLHPGTSRAAPPQPTPWFVEVTDGLPDQPCTPTGCWSNYLTVADLDGDGLLDVVIANHADFFGNGPDDPEPLLVYFNRGEGTFENVSGDAVANYQGRVRQVTIADIDGDGDLDLFAPSADAGADALFVNMGGGTFVDEADARMPNGNGSRAAAARFGDVDHDGDLDLVVADGYAQAENADAYARLYLNEGSGSFVESMSVPTTFSGSDIDDLDLIDVDNDFDLDLVVNAHSGPSELWQNDGMGAFSFAQGALAAPADTRFHYNPNACDIDGDGDLDLWIDNIGPDFGEQLQVNDGMGVFADVTSTRVFGNPSADDNGVLCVDIDNDGIFDAVVLSLETTERLLQNDGNGGFTYLQEAEVFPTPVDPTLWGAFADLDEDGRIDLVTAQGEGPSRLNRLYLATDMVPVDTVAPTIRAVESVTSVAVATPLALRFGVSDRTTTDTGPQLQRAWIETTVAAAKQEHPAIFMGGDLFRAELPGWSGPASATYRACATDRQGNTGCSEAIELTVGTIGTDDGGQSGSESGMDGGPTSGETVGLSGPTSSLPDPSTSAGGAEVQPGQPGCSCAANGRSRAGVVAFVLAFFGWRRRRLSAPGRRLRSDRG